MFQRSFSRCVCQLAVMEEHVNIDSVFIHGSTTTVAVFKLRLRTSVSVHVVGPVQHVAVRYQFTNITQTSLYFSNLSYLIFHITIDHGLTSSSALQQQSTMRTAAHASEVWRTDQELGTVCRHHCPNRHRHF